MEKQDLFQIIKPKKADLIYEQELMNEDLRNKPKLTNTWLADRNNFTHPPTFQKHHFVYLMVAITRINQAS